MKHFCESEQIKQVLQSLKVDCPWQDWSKFKFKISKMFNWSMLALKERQWMTRERWRFWMDWKLWGIEMEQSSSWWSGWCGPEQEVEEDSSSSNTKSSNPEEIKTVQLNQQKIFLTMKWSNTKLKDLKTKLLTLLSFTVYIISKSSDEVILLKLLFDSLSVFLVFLVIIVSFISAIEVNDDYFN